MKERTRRGLCQRFENDLMMGHGADLMFCSFHAFPGVLLAPCPHGRPFPAALLAAAADGPASTNSDSIQLHFLHGRWVSEETPGCG